MWLSTTLPRAMRSCDVLIASAAGASRCPGPHAGMQLHRSARYLEGHSGASRVRTMRYLVLSATLASKPISVASTLVSPRFLWNRPAQR